MNILVIVFVFLIVSTIAIGGVILVYNNLNGGPEDSEKSAERETNTSGIVSIEVLDTGETSDGGSSGGASGGSSGGGSGGSGGAPGLTCREQHVQYSLKNFKESTECVDHFAGKCINFTASCSVDLHNLDVNVLDNFEIEYFLVDSVDNELDSILISNNVDVGAPKTFNANFAIEDLNGVDELSTCKVEMKTVPTKTVCS